jgi:hypothetical protein
MISSSSVATLREFSLGIAAIIFLSFWAINLHRFVGIPRNCARFPERSSSATVKAAAGEPAAGNSF